MTCNGPFCGYGGLDEPAFDAVTCATLETFNCANSPPPPAGTVCGATPNSGPAGGGPNAYSCGTDNLAGLPKGWLNTSRDGFWWSKKAGCDDKHVRGVPTNPNVKRDGGEFLMEFRELTWMKSLLPPTPAPTHCANLTCPAASPCHLQAHTFVCLASSADPGMVFVQCL